MKGFDGSMKAIWTARRKKTGCNGLTTLRLALGLVVGCLWVSSPVLQAIPIPFEATRSIISSAHPSALGGLPALKTEFIRPWAAGAHAALAPTAIPFYKDKTVRVIVPVSAGGSFDVWARLLVRHMSRYLSGKPPFVASSGAGTTGSFIPKLVQKLFGARVKTGEGYPGGVESDLAVARNEMNCRATSI